MSSNNGGPAFPSHGSMGEVAHEGMTLRDYFAAKCLVPFLEGARLPQGYDASAEFRFVAKHAYAMADAMLQARGESA